PGLSFLHACKFDGLRDPQHQGSGFCTRANSMARNVPKAPVICTRANSTAFVTRSTGALVFARVQIRWAAMSPKLRSLHACKFDGLRDPQHQGAGFCTRANSIIPTPPP